jgi:hypothetical protein
MLCSTANSSALEVSLKNGESLLSKGLQLLLQRQCYSSLLGQQSLCFDTLYQLSSGDADSNRCRTIPNPRILVPACRSNASKIS